MSSRSSSLGCLEPPAAAGPLLEESLGGPDFRHDRFFAALWHCMFPRPGLLGFRLGRVSQCRTLAVFPPALAVPTCGHIDCRSPGYSVVTSTGWHSLSWLVALDSFNSISGRQYAVVDGIDMLIVLSLCLQWFPLLPGDVTEEAVLMMRELWMVFS